MPEAQEQGIEYNYLLGRKPRARLNSHELNRDNVFSMILNTGPTQTHVDPETRETLNQPFKITYPIENPGGYIIPGIYPQGCLLSVFTTVGAPLLGLAAGATDSRHIDDFKKKLQGETSAYRFAGLSDYSKFAEYNKYPMGATGGSEGTSGNSGGGKGNDRKGGSRRSGSRGGSRDRNNQSRISINVYGSKNNVTVPTDNSNNYKVGIDGSYWGNINFPRANDEYLGKDKKKGKGDANEFGEVLHWKQGALGKYSLEIEGILERGSIVRKHKDK